MTQITLPDFNKVNPATIKQTLETLLNQNRVTIEQLLETVNPTWETLIVPIETLDNTLDLFWSTISHLHAVKQSDALEETYQACLPLLSAYHTEIGQNKKLFEAYKKIKESHAFQTFNSAKQKIIENALRDFQLSGVDLPPEKKKRFKEIAEKLVLLSNQFEHNVMTATESFCKIIPDKNLLQGIPEHSLNVMHENAKKKGEKGYALTLDFPCYHAVMAYCDDRDLRKEIYTAYVTRAENNTPLIEEILNLREEQATLLGFENFAALSLAPKMADIPSEVLDFLNDLCQKLKPYAQTEWEVLQNFAKKQGPQNDLQMWDILYYSEKQKKSLFDFDEEALRVYFPIEKVLNGMFETVKKLYGVKIQPIALNTWDPAVSTFEIQDQNKQVCGIFYVDLYARDKKREGAWMDDYCSRLRFANNQLQIPVAFLTCNFMPPEKGKPALLSHEEVITLFHEFGHTLHHLLTQIEERDVAGIHGVPWDAVELPSQFMERFASTEPVISLISAHYQTHEPLPKTILEKLIAAKNFRAASHLLRQLEFALFDFRLHCEWKKSSSVQAILDDVRKKTAIMSIPEFNKSQNTFSHIFAGSYAAGYYSYLWAEVLACDAFFAFPKNNILDKATGEKFLKNILEKGGSEDILDLFKAFRGRAPDKTALLKDHGLA